MKTKLLFLSLILSTLAIWFAIGNHLTKDNDASLTKDNIVLIKKDNILIKKDSLLSGNSNGTFNLIKGCYIKYDKNNQKTIESCLG